MDKFMIFAKVMDGRIESFSFLKDTYVELPLQIFEFFKIFKDLQDRLCVS